MDPACNYSSNKQNEFQIWCKALKATPKQLQEMSNEELVSRTEKFKTRLRLNIAKQLIAYQREQVQNIKKKYISFGRPTSTCQKRICAGKDDDGFKIDKNNIEIKEKAFSSSETSFTIKNPNLSNKFEEIAPKLTKRLGGGGVGADSDIWEDLCQIANGAEELYERDDSGTEINRDIWRILCRIANDVEEIFEENSPTTSVEADTTFENTDEPGTDTVFDSQAPDATFHRHSSESTTKNRNVAGKDTSSDSQAPESVCHRHSSGNRSHGRSRTSQSFRPNADYPTHASTPLTSRPKCQYHDAGRRSRDHQNNSNATYSTFQNRDAPGTDTVFDLQTRDATFGRHNSCAFDSTSGNRSNGRSASKQQRISQQFTSRAASIPSCQCQQKPHGGRRSRDQSCDWNKGETTFDSSCENRDAIGTDKNFDSGFGSTCDNRSHSQSRTTPSLRLSATCSPTNTTQPFIHKASSPKCQCHKRPHDVRRSSDQPNDRNRTNTNCDSGFTLGNDTNFDSQAREATYHKHNSCGFDSTFGNRSHGRRLTTESYSGGSNNSRTFAPNAGSTRICQCHTKQHVVGQAQAQPCGFNATDTTIVITDPSGKDISSQAEDPNVSHEVRGARYSSQCTQPCSDNQNESRPSTNNSITITRCGDVANRTHSIVENGRTLCVNRVLDEEGNLKFKIYGSYQCPGRHSTCKNSKPKNNCKKEVNTCDNEENKTENEECNDDAKAQEEES